MKQVTVAVIGCGAIANRAHLPALSAMPDVRIKYAVDIIPERASAAVQKYGCEQAVTDYRVAAGDGEVDAVYVLTPNHAHYEITMDCLRQGKHVFCEKPVTVSYPKSAEMAQAAAENNVTLNIGVCNRYHRTVERIRDLAAAGALGRIYHVYCSFRNFRSIPGLGGAFTTKAASGGGVLIDWGVHFLDLILYITGARARAVSAADYGLLGGDIAGYTYTSMWAGPPDRNGVYDVDDFVSGFVRTDGPTISFNGAWAQNVDEEEMYVDFLGDKAGVRMQYGGGFKVFGARDGALYAAEEKYTIPDMYAEEDADFIRAVRSGKRCRNHIDDVLDTMRLLDAIYRSGREGREVTL